MNWNDYVARRSINVSQWLQIRGVSDRESFLKVLADLKVEPPDESQFALMFPEVPKIEEAVRDESATVTPEGVDQAPTRSVASEGDGTGQRPNRKRTSKVRG